MTGTFIDTIVICTMTGLAILLTNSHTSGLEGAAMTTLAFNKGLFIPMIGKYVVNIDVYKRQSLKMKIIQLIYNQFM